MVSRTEYYINYEKKLCYTLPEILQIVFNMCIASYFYLKVKI